MKSHVRYKKMITRIVGDIHGKYSDYQMIVNPESQKVQRSIQLGELDFVDFDFDKLEYVK
jgi:hypothetical protein